MSFVQPRVDKSSKFIMSLQKPFSDLESFLAHYKPMVIYTLKRHSWHSLTRHSINRHFPHVLNFFAPVCEALEWMLRYESHRRVSRLGCFMQLSSALWVVCSVLVMEHCFSASLPFLTQDSASVSELRLRRLGQRGCAPAPPLSCCYQVSSAELSFHCGY